MINKIIVLSRKEFQSWLILRKKPNTLFGDWALISIHGADGPIITPDTLPVLKAMDCTQSISLRFADILPKEFSRYRHLVENSLDSDLFNTDHANAILDFIANLKDETTLLVHCAAGISRSGAVGLFCCHYWNLDIRDYYKRNPDVDPNTYIFDILQKTYKERKEMSNTVHYIKDPNKPEECCCKIEINQPQITTRKELVTCVKCLEVMNKEPK